MRRLTIWMCVLAAVLGVGAYSRTEEDEDIRVDMTALAKDSPGERPVIRLWHIYGSDDDQAMRIIGQLTREAEDKFNVAIEVDTAGDEGYEAKTKAAAVANGLPDIFYTWSHELLKPMIGAGRVLEVSRYYSGDFQSRLDDAMMEGIQFDGRTYALPLDSSVAMVYYNMEMMGRHGLEMPVTWDEFAQACQTFVGNGITPMPVRGSEPWAIAMYYDLLALREVGPEKVADTAAGQTDYSDPGLLETAGKLCRLVDMRAFTANSATALREEAEVLLMQDQAPMYLSDSWTSSRVYKESSRVAGKVKATPFPVTGSGKSTIYDFTGGPDSAFAVSSSTKDLELTVSLARYMAMGLTVELYRRKSSNLPYINADTGDAQLNLLMQEIHEYTDHTASYTIWWNDLLEETDAARYLDSLGCLLRGGITPEEFISCMNGLKQDETDDRRETGWR